MFRAFVCACALAAAPLAWAGPAAPSAAAPAAAFDALVDQYYREWAKQHPTSATGVGWHEHDGEVEEVSPAAREQQLAWIRKWQAKLLGVDAQALDPWRRSDLSALRSSLEASLVELEVVQGWRRFPDRYLGAASSAVYGLIKRTFAPPEQRLRSVIAREEKLPRLLADGQKNLKGFSRVSVEIALDELPGIVSFFQKDVPLAFPTVKDPALTARLAQTTAAVVRALESYRDFLQKALPDARGPIAIGAEAFSKKLAAEEGIDTPLPELLARGESELKRLQAEFQATARKIDPKKPYATVQLEVQKDHASAEQLIPSVQGRLAALRQFLVDQHIVTLPSDAVPLVQETPPFMRAVTLASMDTPGPFEVRGEKAFFNLTLPEARWTQAQAEDYLRGGFNRPLVDVLIVHEAFPGHFTQFIYLPQVRGKVRKVEGANTNIEGWAHYCEQMLLDEGFGAGDPKLRLSQLQDALLRAARYVVGLRMHTRGMSFEEAMAYFQKEGYQTREVAQVEARRGTEDPTYLYYTLGKLEILKLREDYKKKLGPAYTLQKFHDAFLAQGALALPLVRKALLE